jgi:hypothetical protein
VKCWIYFAKPGLKSPGFFVLRHLSNNRNRRRPENQPQKNTKGAKIHHHPLKGF